MARLVPAAVALALALPASAAAHPFAPRHRLSFTTGPGEPAPSASPGPWTHAAAAAPSGAAPSAADDPAAAPAPAPVPSLAPLALPEHPTFIRPALDVPVIALGAAISIGTYFAGQDLRWAGCGACDPSAIGGLDRRVLGNDDRAAALASDIFLYGAIALPFVVDLGDALAGSRSRPGGARHAAGGWLRDAVVLAEVLTVNLGLTNIVKYAVRRPRPYSYDPDNMLADVGDNDARLSMYSGHASTAFAMLTASAMLFTLRHPRARAAVPVWLAAVALASTTGLLRVVAGKHFWTDVLSGAFAGAAVGVLVPAVHATRWRRVAPGLSWAPRGALVTLGGRF